MSDHIEWVLEMDVQDGMSEAVLPLISEMVIATRENEPGALTYEYYLTEDKSRCTVLERYADSDALMTHLGNFRTHFAERFFKTFAPVRFTVYGPANDTVRSALSELGATFDSRIGGFHR